MPTACRFRRLLRVLLTIAFTVLPAVGRAQSLPSLPLPDCVANGLPIDDTALCEGSNTGYIQGFPAGVQYGHGEVTLGIGSRDVDFRNDTDRAPQFITLTLAAPGPRSDGEYLAAVEREWPVQLEDDIFVDRRYAGDIFWNGATGGKPFNLHQQNPPYSLLTHEGVPCANTDTSCTYRVNWDAYPTPAVLAPLIYRVCVDWDVNYVFVDPQHAGGSCGTDPVNGCIAGGGRSCVTFQTTPPPGPKAVGTATRIGSKQFTYDASDSTDANLIEDYHWVLLAGVAPAQHVHDKTFDHDYNDDNLPKYVNGDIPTLIVTDRYKRTATTLVFAEFLGGVESFLEIVSFEVVDVSNGVATLKAIVKNKDATKTVTAVFLQGQRSSGTLVQSTPASTEIEPGESVEFTVTTAVDTTDPFFVDVTAFGNVDTGPVKSKSASQLIGSPTGPGDADTSVTGTANPGDGDLDVGDTGPFGPGDYAGIDPGPNAEVRRVRQVANHKSLARAGATPGSLVFDAPLANAHAVGAEVYKIDAPDDDTTGPVVTVTSPLAGQVVCAGAPLTAEFSCSDPGVGLELCGDGVADGQALDTATFGNRATTVRAWDFNGNVTEHTVAWAVSFCDASIDSFHCFLAKPAKGEKFAPIPGVRVAGPVDDLIVDLKKPTLFCAPADTSADGVLDGSAHLEGYALKPQKGQPKTVPQAGVRLASQVGIFTVDTAKLAALLVPTAQDPTNAPAPLSNPNVDRFACYGAKLAKGQPKLAKDLQITVEDGLTNPAKRFAVKKLQSLCVPVTAAGGATKHPDQLLCFKVAPTKGVCSDTSQVNPGRGCKKEADCGGVKGQTTLCTVQGKFAKAAGMRVLNDLGSGALDAAKDAIVCLPAVPAP